MQYRVIHVTYAFSLKRALEQLTRQVGEAVSLGWEPLGGVCVSGTSVIQAMVKRR